MNLEARVDKLERDNKTLKKMLGGVAALALAALIGGTVLGVHAANGTFDTITARNLKLIDSRGKSRVFLSGSSGILHLYDSSGTPLVELHGLSGKIKARSISAPAGPLHTHSSSPTSHTHSHSPRSHTHSYSPTSHKHSYSSTSHKHTASSASARKGRNKHSHKLTVK